MTILKTDEALERLVRLIMRYDPERIILFGSRARGEADEHSDYDLIVIGARYVASRLRGLLMGDVTRQIVDRAPCPALVVRPSGR